MKKILATGNALVDALVVCRHDGDLHSLGLQRGGMTLISNEEECALRQHIGSQEVQKSSGGSAANTSLSLGLQNAQVAYIGKVGKDENADFFEQELQAKGIECHLLHSATEPTGIAYTFVSPDGERTFATRLGAAATMTLDDLTPELFRGHDILYVEGYLVQDHELMLGILRMADKEGMEIALDMASYTVVMEHRDFFRQILTEYVDIVFANREEAMAYAFGGGDVSHMFEPEAIAAIILGRTCRVAVVKLGADGAIYHDNDSEGRCPAVPVEKVVDTTGAGDFFAGGFLGQYAKGCSTQECVENGARMSARVIQVMGTRL